MWILPLDAPDLGLADGGGKALNLGRMRRAGLPVPDGFVLTTAAYRQFVAERGLAATIGAAWEAPDRDAAAAALRARFEAEPVPEEVAAAVRAALPAGPVAVRSSATAEDLPEASFAGQQDSFLHVEGVEAVLTAIRRAWASLWTARAMAYRARQGIGPDEVALAVVVQRMVPATAAGVLFTVHPLTGRADRAVINASWGLGEALVGGRVNPDSYVVAKADGRVLRADVADKAVMTVPAAAGTTEREVPDPDRRRRVLDDAQLAELVGLGRRLEALFGGPQDVEWALAGEIVLLQSRAVTTPAPTPPGDDAWPPTDRGEALPFDFWTQQDMGERWPEPLTPLTWSACEPMNQAILDGMVAGLAAPWAGRVAWSRRAFGRAWMNEGALLQAFCVEMGMPLQMMRSGLTHPAAAPAGAEGWRLGPALRHAGVFWRVATTWEPNVDRFERLFPEIDREVEAWAARGRSGLDDAAVLAEGRRFFDRLLEVVALHTNATSLAMSSTEELGALVSAQGGDAALVQDLLGGITGIITAEMAPALAEMARILREAGLADRGYAELRDEPRAAPFWARFDEFLRRHGHRAATEAELRHPRWWEQPELVFAQLAPYLAGVPAPAADAVARREAATAALRARLGFFARARFDRALARCHRFTRMRDNGQGYVVKLLLPVRASWAELGRRLVARGQLREADDVWFLVVDEIEAAVAGRGLEGLQAAADARRAAHSFWCGQPCPEALDAALEPVPPAPVEGDPRVLVGIPASRGLVEGVARVVASPAEAGRLRPGEILVTRATDPGWTPVFSVIGGAVLEIGGQLSHGAIVAREYGLPAVVNVSACTRRIPDGARVRVDGGKGRVELLD